MIWLIPLLVIIILLLMLKKYKILLWLFATLLMIGSILFYQYELKDKWFTESSRPRFKDIDIQNINFKNLRSNSYQVTARIYNLSDQYDLQQVSLKIELQDCLHQMNNGQSELVCPTIAEETIHIRQSIPAKQARDIRHTIHFRNTFQIHHQAQWNYQIKEVK